MKTKLTLKLNKRLIDRAKIYANTHNTSLSKIIESYLDSVTEETVSNSAEITPLVKSLSGVIQLDKVYDFKKENSYIHKNHIFVI
jgi:hypothetical protein